MTFRELELPGAFLIELDRIEDERGFFARTFCRDEFAEHGLATEIVQANTAFNRRKGTLRGMHFQAAPHEEAKLVRCTRGAVYDVIVDLRRDSPTFTRWVSVELTVENDTMLYVPEGFAHGYQTLEDETETSYLMSQRYEPSAGRGVRWDDPAFGIEWPDEGDRTMNERDRTWPDFSPDAAGA
ncbi:MAG TPA: dTDP-4-dehydrorhamnose 3,5-epimerase [Gaiellaceae bacterium]|jgi:dTDP-4-dehydrorhamnose 3,5-epimerase|nr:dTDP-4-dehydrorhamnose 3,5-epimerase [Gaiellaceae bacterium]